MDINRKIYWSYVFLQQIVPTSDVEKFLQQFLLGWWMFIISPKLGGVGDLQRSKNYDVTIT